MSSIPTSLSDLYKRYKKWVGENPQVVGDVETTIKWLSYFIAGRINSSPIISELIYSLSNLLVLFNDRIITKCQYVRLQDRNETNLRLLLTTLEYCEVFIEITAAKLWGTTGRWFFIFVVQVIKCIGRMLLVFKHKQLITHSPPIAPINRKTWSQSDDDQITNQSNNFTTNSAFTFTLKRSGKVIRKVEGAPPIHLRSWKPLADEALHVQSIPKIGKIFTLAESLYIFKPLLHLTCSSVVGMNTWKSYSLSLLLDIASLRIYYDQRDKLTKEQKMELSKRCVSLLLYLMRSPFYDRCSRDRINRFIMYIAKTIPLTNVVCKPLLDYIPHWQSTYFYMWST